MKILVLNCGSSSIKFQLIETSVEMIAADADRCIAKGSIEKIGTDEAVLHLAVPPNPEQSIREEMLDEQTALMRCIQALKDANALGDISQIEAVGHRVVHGGERYSASVLIDEEVVKVIQQCSELAPLHNPNNLRGYLVARKVFPRSRKLRCLTRHFTTPCLPRLISTACPIPITSVTRSGATASTAPRIVTWRTIAGRCWASTKKRLT